MLKVACLQSCPWAIMSLWMDLGSVLQTYLWPCLLLLLTRLLLWTWLIISPSLGLLMGAASLPELCHGLLCCWLLCLACFLAGPSLALPTWLPALTRGLPRHCRLSWSSLDWGWPQLVPLSRQTHPTPCPSLLQHLAAGSPAPEWSLVLRDWRKGNQRQ